MKSTAILRMLSILAPLFLALSGFCLEAGAQGSGNTAVRFDRAVFSSGTQNSGAIIQDRDGFIWIGTNAAGLIRYDGYDMKVYKPGGPNSLIDPYVLALYEDSKRMIWIGAATGLFKYDKMTDTFTRYQHDPQDPTSISGNTRTLGYMQTIVEDRDGLLWIGTTQGLNAFDRKTETFTRYLHDPANPNSLSNNDVRALLVDRQGLLWIGTNGGGLDRLDQKTGTFTHYAHDLNDPQSLGDNVVTALVEDDEGTLWLGTQGNGLQRFDRDSGVFTHYPCDSHDSNSPGDNYVLSLYQDGSGIIWIGYVGVARAGVTSFDRRTLTFTHYHHNPDDPNTISTPAVSGVYEDRTGILWFVNDVGAVDKYDPHRCKFKLYGSSPNDPNSLIAAPVVPIYQDRSGAIWVGTFPGWQKYDKQTHTFTRYINDIYFPGVYEDSTGTLWLGSGVPCALHVFDRAIGKIVETYTYDPNNSNSLSRCMQINAIVEDLNDVNTLWLAMSGTVGLEKFDKRTGKFTHYGHDPNDPNTLSGNDLWMLYRDREGILWLPTIGAGLDRFDPRTGIFTHYVHNPDDPHSISSDATNVVLEDSSGNLWIGGAAGFDRLDRETGTFTRYTDETGYPVTSILSIGEDNQGNLWLASGSGDGLARFDPRTETIKLYRVSDGLPSDVFFVRNGLRDRDGEMWFGGPNGMISFYPEEIVDNAFIPPLAITALKQGGEEMPLGQSPERVQEIALDWQHNYFEFEYVALSYTQAQKNQYKYMLEGLDKDWFYAGTRRFGRYSGLHGGEYMLRIIGSNNDGVWNEEGVSLRVKVIPPWWKRWWFYALVIAGALGAGLFIYRAKSNQLKAIQAAALAVQERERHLRTIFDSVNDAIFVHDIPSGAILDVNARMCTMYGYTREEALQTKMDDMSSGEPPYTAREILAWVQKAAREGPQLFEWRARAKDGHLFWVEVSMRLASIGGQDRVFVAVRDITERKRAEEALRMSEDKFAKAFRTSPDAVCISRMRDGRYLEINDGFTAMTGYTPADAVGKTAPEVNIWADLQSSARLRQSLMEHGEVIGLEAEFRTKDGSIHTGLMSARLIEVGGEPCVLSITRDITERKRAEVEREALIAELEAKNAELERFTYTVSHDLKSPLITIGGFVGFLEKDALVGDVERVKADIARINDAAARMQRLLGELLELSRIGRLVNSPEEVSFAEVAGEAVELVHGRIAARGVEVEIAPDLPTIYGDRARLVEVVQNLVDNAVKFMGDQPYPCIEIGQREMDADGKPILFVRDNGMGIESRYHDKVFGLFEKLDAQSEGTGVGLTLVKRIVETHGGKIWVESAGAGQGTIFCFSLPGIKPGMRQEAS